VQLRAFASAARGADQAGVLERVLDGSEVPQGLAVDTDLRWTLVQALAALGRFGDAEVDAELARDDTAAGRRVALTARAAQPDATAKERAWGAATRDDELSNHEADALAAGVWRHGQDALLRGYVDRYVDELPAVWDQRGPQVSRSLALRLFPATLVEQDVLDRTAALLDERHPPGLRRCVAEQRDDLARALRARAAG
jgi:aminopeptidase N